MPRMRISKEDTAKRPRATRSDDSVKTFRGLTERQWFISMLVVSSLLLLVAFRGCILPTGVSPKNKPAAQTTASPTPEAAQTAGEYSVVAGDTLSSIARKNNVSLEALASANGIDLNQRVILRVGQKLKIPSGATPTQ